MSYSNWFETHKIYDKEVGLSYDDVVLVPQRSCVRSRRDVDISACIAPNIRLDMPIMSAAMDTVTNGRMAAEMAILGGIGIIHRFQSIDERFKEASLTAGAGLPVGVAVGLKDTVEQCKHLSEIADILAIDVAHAHSNDVLEFCRKLDSAITNETAIMAGNIATRSAARDFIGAGADILKVGIGSGAVCTTRSVTGFGVPNVTAISYVRQAVMESKYNRLITVVADGGIRSSSDIAKAIAAGADCVMLGSLLAGTDCTPGDVVDGKKLFRGMASMGAQLDHGGTMYGVAAEGISVMVPYKGRTSDVMWELAYGLNSALTYGNARNLKDFYAETTFLRVATGAAAESRPHILDRPDVERRDSYRIKGE